MTISINRFNNFSLTPQQNSNRTNKPSFGQTGSVALNLICRTNRPVYQRCESNAGNAMATCVSTAKSLMEQCFPRLYEMLDTKTGIKKVYDAQLRLVKKVVPGISGTSNTKITTYRYTPTRRGSRIEYEATIQTPRGLSSLEEKGTIIRKSRRDGLVKETYHRPDGTHTHTIISNPRTGKRVSAVFPNFPYRGYTTYRTHHPNGNRAQEIELKNGRLQSVWDYHEITGNPIKLTRHNQSNLPPVEYYDPNNRLRELTPGSGK